MSIFFYFSLRYKCVPHYKVLNKLTLTSLSKHNFKLKLFSKRSGIRGWDGGETESTSMTLRSGATRVFWWRRANRWPSPKKSLNSVALPLVERKQGERISLHRLCAIPERKCFLRAKEKGRRKKKREEKSHLVRKKLFGSLFERKNNLIRDIRAI